jgi:hypothetical protein
LPLTDRVRQVVGEVAVRRYWSEKLGVTQAAIRQAVERVGPMVEDVRRELGK